MYEKDAQDKDGMSQGWAGILQSKLCPFLSYTKSMQDKGRDCHPARVPLSSQVSLMRASSCSHSANPEPIRPGRVSGEQPKQ